MKTLLRGALAIVGASMVFSAPAAAQSAYCDTKNANGNCVPGTDTVVRAPATDRGASVGTSAQTLMALNSQRRGYKIQNQSSTADCYINGQATATADYHSLKISAGTYYESLPTHVDTGAISIICSAASTSVYAREW